LDLIKPLFEKKNIDFEKEKERTSQLIKIQEELKKTASGNQK
jgi:hypothetical protein